MTNRRGGSRASANNRQSINHNAVTTGTPPGFSTAPVVQQGALTQSTTIGSTSNTESSNNHGVRGITSGKGVRKAMRTAKDRLKVKFDENMGVAICDNASNFNNEIGYIARQNCSLQYKEWRLVPEEIKAPLRDKLTITFDIDTQKKEVRDIIDAQMGKALKNFKSTLKREFIQKGGDEDLSTVKTLCPKKVTQEDWEYLCDYWASDECKARASANVEARAKRKGECRNGSKSTARHHVSRGIDLDAPTGQIETWKIRHWTSEKGWTSTDLQIKYEEMLQLRQANSPETMTDKMILEKVLGRESNRLFGWGRSPSKSRARTSGEGSRRITYTEGVNTQELKELKDQVAMMREALLAHNIIPPSSVQQSPLNHSSPSPSHEATHIAEEDGDFSD